MTVTSSDGAVTTKNMAKPSYKENDAVYFHHIPENANLETDWMRWAITQNKIGHAALAKFKRPPLTKN